MGTLGIAPPEPRPGRYRLIACEVLYREMCAAVSRAISQVDVEFVPKGLHDLGAEPMRERLQARVDAVPAGKYDAILLGYALCNNGVVGLVARETPLVLPRAHDCISLFLGSRQRYQEYFAGHAGAYYATSGWLERGDDAGELREQSLMHRQGLDLSWRELVAKYGEEEAEFIRETLGNYTRNYDTLAYIAMGLPGDPYFDRWAEAVAAAKGWRLDRLQGDLRLCQQLVDGNWPEADFLTIPPGHAVAPTHRDDIVAAHPCAACPARAGCAPTPRSETVP